MSELNPMAALSEAKDKIVSEADKVVAKVTHRRTFGPALHFRGIKPNGTWSVSISAAADEDVPIEIDAISANIHAKEPDTFKVEGGKNPKALVFQNLTVDVVLGQQESEAEYTCKIGEQSATYKFAVPAASQEPRMLYFSCNDTPLQETRDETPKLYNAWEFLRNNYMTPAVGEGQGAPTTKNPPLHFMFGGGDNIYADEIFKKVLLDEEFGKGEAYDLILDFYIDEYLRRFGTGDANMAHALATIPCFMQADDHDYYNGYGSFIEERKFHPNIGKAAQITRCAFQIGIPTTVTIQGKDAILENMTRVARLGPNTVMLSLDHRSNRDVDKKQLMEMAYFDQKLAEAKQLCADGNTHHLVVFFASPVFWNHGGFKEVYANVMKNVPVASIFATDALDMMQSQDNIAQTTEMLHKLFKMAQEAKVRLLFISGDVHNGGHGTVRAENVAEDNDFRYAQQWISSPIANYPDETTGVELMKKELLGSKKQWDFAADPTKENGKLLADLDSVWDGKKNFLLIHAEGTNLVGQLYVEDNSGDNYIPTETKWVSSPATFASATRKAEDDGGCCSMM